MLGNGPRPRLLESWGFPASSLQMAEAVAAHGGAFPGSGRQAEAAAEVTRLWRELARVTEERDILKKAAAYFAREST